MEAALFLRQLALSTPAQTRLVGEYISKGKCVDFVIHDTGGGNPHCHIMLTMRPLDERGAWAAKSKKVYALTKTASGFAYQAADA